MTSHVPRSTYTNLLRLREWRKKDELDPKTIPVNKKGMQTVTPTIFTEEEKDKYPNRVVYKIGAEERDILSFHLKCMF